MCKIKWHKTTCVKCIYMYMKLYTRQNMYGHMNCSGKNLQFNPTDKILKILLT